MGPIEYVEFAFDEHEMCENFALVVFKYSSSVEDSIKLFYGTKLYGLPIITKNYSKHLEDPVFNDQLNFFKQLVNVERNNQSNDKECNKDVLFDHNSDNKFNIPDSLPEPPVYDCIDVYKDNYDNKLETMSRHSHTNKLARYQHDNPNNKDYLIEKSYHTREFNQSPGRSTSSSTMEISNNHVDSYNKIYDYKKRDYGVQTSSNWNKSTQNQELPYINKKNCLKDVHDLRNMLYQKRSLSDSDYHDTNSTLGCTDIRDSMHHNKRSKYDDVGVGHYYESNTNNQRLEINKKKTHSNNNFSNKNSCKNDYNSEYYTESNNRHQNHYYTDRDYNGRSFIQERSLYESYQKHGNANTNNYHNDIYGQEKNRFNNNYNNMYHQYFYQPRSEHNRGKNFKGNTERARKN